MFNLCIAGIQEREVIENKQKELLEKLLFENALKLMLEASGSIYKKFGEQEGKIIIVHLFLYK